MIEARGGAGAAVRPLPPTAPRALPRTALARAVVLPEMLRVTALAALLLAAGAAALDASGPGARLPGSAPPVAAAALVPPAEGGGEWRPLPIWGGDIRSLAVAPDSPDVVLAGTSAGQLYVSTDGGGSWSNAGALLPFPGWVVAGLGFDPNRPRRVWAALWGVWGNGQVAYSDDLGKSWSARSQGLPNGAVYTVAMVPGHEGRMFAATAAGVYGTEDGGGSWRPLTGGLPDVEKVTSLMVDPTRPDTVIAGTWRRAYRSDDAGHTWTGIFEGMVLDTEVFSLTPIPERPGEIWASSCGWVYQTLDRGDHWVRFKDGLDERRTPSLLALPDRMLAGTVSGVFASFDGGRSWKRQSDPALAVSVMAFDPARPGRVIAGTEGSGIWLSKDGGASFYRASRGMTSTRVGALALAADELLVAVNQAGPISGIYLSRDRGRSFNSDFWPLPTVLDLASSGGRTYAATERGLYERRGVDWHRLPELGSERVEQLVALGGDRLLVRTAGALFELAKDRVAAVPYKHGLPRSAAFFGEALWISDAEGLYRLSKEANHTVPAPFAGGRLQRLDDQLLLWGAGGAWVRSADADASWVELVGEPSRLVPTGDERFAALLVTGETLRLYDRDAHRFRVLTVPVPARDVTAALVVDGKLLLATSGYGVLVRELAGAGPQSATKPPPAE
ncbi:MAG TPA: hypothetical protein VHR45_23785 [Thermoanaerobaculia bacterium]|nr:hypothetical protein [Thermoanaerobaculia bacterium]